MKKYYTIGILVMLFSVFFVNSVYAKIDNPCEPQEGGGDDEIIRGTNGDILILSSRRSACVTTGGGGGGTNASALSSITKTFTKENNGRISASYSWNKLDAEATKYTATLTTLVNVSVFGSQYVGTNSNPTHAISLVPTYGTPAQGFCQPFLLNIKSYDKEEKLIRERSVQDCIAKDATHTKDPRTNKTYSTVTGSFENFPNKTFSVNNEEAVKFISTQIGTYASKLHLLVLDSNLNEVSRVTKDLKAPGGQDTRFKFKVPSQNGTYYVKVITDKLIDGTLDMRRIDVWGEAPEATPLTLTKRITVNSNVAQLNVDFNRRTGLNYKATYKVTDINNPSSRTYSQTIPAGRKTFSLEPNYNPGEAAGYCRNYEVTITAHDPKQRNAIVETRSLSTCMMRNGSEGTGKNPSTYVAPISQPILNTTCSVTTLVNGSNRVEVDRNAPLTFTWTSSQARSVAIETTNNVESSSEASGKAVRNAPNIPGTYTYTSSCFSLSNRRNDGSSVTVVVRQPVVQQAPLCTISISGPGRSYEGQSLTFSWTSQNVDGLVQVTDNDENAGNYPSNSSYSDNQAISSTHLFKVTGTNVEGKVCSSTYSHTVEIPSGDRRELIVQTYLPQLQSLQASVASSKLSQSIKNSVSTAISALIQRLSSK